MWNMAAGAGTRESKAYLAVESIEECESRDGGNFAGKFFLVRQTLGSAEARVGEHISCCAHTGTHLEVEIASGWDERFVRVSKTGVEVWMRTSEAHRCRYEP